MGKTVPSFRIALEMKRKEWKPFRIALEKLNRKKFEELIDTTDCTFPSVLIPFGGSHTISALCLKS
jgi:hypothetical protein